MIEDEYPPQPQIVIGVTNGIAECILNDTSSDYLILNFDLLDEYGTKEENEHVDDLLKKRLFNECSAFLADVEGRVSREVFEAPRKEEG